MKGETVRKLYVSGWRMVVSLLVAVGVFSIASAMLGCDPVDETAGEAPGTGDSTIKGNVVSIGAQAAYAEGYEGARMAGVTVSIDGTDLQAVTDGGGRFTLTGVPATTIELRFVSGAVVGILVLDMPPGTTLELRDVRVTSQSVEVGQVYEVETETVTEEGTEPETAPGDDGWSDEDSDDEDSDDESGDDGSGEDDGDSE